MKHLMRDRVQGMIALVLILAVLSLVMKGDPIPEVLEWSLATVLGFYFGAQYGAGSNNPNIRKPNGGYK